MNKPNSLSIDIATELPPENAPGQAAAVCVFADEPRAPTDAARLDEELRRACEQALQDGEFDGEAETALMLRVQAAGGRPLRRVLLVGLGRRADFDEAVLRRAAGVAAREARASRVKDLHFLLPPRGEAGDARSSARAVAGGALLGLYDNDFYQRQDDDEPAPALERLTIVAPHGGDGELSAEVERARVVAESVNWARTLADEPGLSLPPREFARRAAEMAAEVGLRVETLGAEEIRARGMGALLGVAQGSEEEPSLIVLRYEPEGARDDDELWAFVGKGITFDTGGISLKRGPGMEEMKSDMAGGAADASWA